MKLNDKFNRLTLISIVDKKDNAGVYRVFGKFKCDCGTFIKVPLWRVKTGHTKSCGCLQRDKLYIAQMANRKEKGEAGRNYVLYQLKRGAKIRNLTFELTNDQVHKLSQSPCHYCGAKPSMIRSTKTQYGDYVYNGIDRVDNSMGYTTTNVVTCCIFCNRMKMAHTQTEFLDKIKQIYEHLELSCKN